MAQTTINDSKSRSKPEKPDEEIYKASLKKAEKEHAESMARLTEIKEKLDIAMALSNDSLSSNHRADLVRQSKEIREKQNSGKTNSNKLLEQIRKEETIVKDMISQQKTARSRVNFMSAEDLNREIDRLHIQINTGTMKIVDEKKALDTISLLHKQRKNFAEFEKSQQAIDVKKVQIKKLRDNLHDSESRALSEKYNEIQIELDTIKAKQDDIYKNINNLRDERKRLQDEQQAKYLAIKELKNNYFEQTRAVQKWEYEARQRVRDRKRAEEEKFQQEKKKARAQQILAEASDKAFLDEIRRAHSLLHFLDPSYSASTEKAPLQAPSKLHAIPQRQVDGPEIKGVRIAKKDEEDYFTGNGGKKSKKAKKLNLKDNSLLGKYSCPPSVMEDCAIMGIDPPLSAADIPSVKSKVFAKLEYWKANQDAETERNIAKAKKELERLEAEESRSSTPPLESNPSHEIQDGNPTCIPVESEEINNNLRPHSNGQKHVLAPVDLFSELIELINQRCTIFLKQPNDL